MKKLITLSLFACFLFAGCDASQEKGNSNENPQLEEQQEKDEESQERVILPNIFTPLVEILQK